MDKKKRQQQKNISSPSHAIAEPAQSGAGRAAEVTPVVPPKAASSAGTNTKTPLFHAMHAERYQRQSLIKRIQEEHTRRKLICYVAGSSALISRDDTLGMVDLLHNIPTGSDLDFLLHTPGGDMDAAEKLISMIRNRVANGHLRVIVPDFAKSAGTLMAIGSDLIAMSDSSELGPIDPQITLNDAHDNPIPHSIHSYLDAYKAHSEAVQKNPADEAARIMLGKLDPATIKVFEAASRRARAFAESQLKRGMLRNESSYTKVASDLLDTTRWLSHGQMIDHNDALGIGLKVQYLDPQSAEWQLIWQLYALQRMAVKDDCKLFESDWVSVPLGA